jgi:hypothetical protein
MTDNRTLTKETSYAEAIGLLYSSNRFNFQWAQDATAFRNSILPQRAAAIRAVQLHYPIDWDLCGGDLIGWRGPYIFLSSLTQLRTLDLIFEADPDDAQRRNDLVRDIVAKLKEEDLLKMICTFRDEVSVTLALGSATTGLLDQIEGCGKPNLHVLRPPDSLIFEAR